MVPAWTQKMLIRGAILASACLVLVGGIWLVSALLGQNAQGGKLPNPVAKSADLDVGKLKKEDAKPVAKLVPGEANLPKEPASSSSKDAGPITLVDAINVLEKAGKGTVVKAEKRGEGGNASFDLETVAAGGSRTKYNINATGKVIIDNGIVTQKGSGNKKRPREGSRDN